MTNAQLTARRQGRLTEYEKKGQVSWEEASEDWRQQRWQRRSYRRSQSRRRRRGSARLVATNTRRTAGAQHAEGSWTSQGLELVEQPDAPPGIGAPTEITDIEAAIPEARLVGATLNSALA